MTVRSCQQQLLKRRAYSRALKVDRIIADPPAPKKSSPLKSLRGFGDFKVRHYLQIRLR
jgi:hypothetical protein